MNSVNSPPAARPSAALFLASPVGPLRVEYGPDAVREVSFWPEAAAPPAGARDEPAEGDALGQRIVREFQDFFAGERWAFSLPLELEGTEFQRRVWEQLRRIPAGQTRTYAQLADALGNPAATRAVGQANRRNRLPILVPCHRVVAAGGSLGGYLGSDGSTTALHVKRWLLRHEGAMSDLDLL